MSARPPRRAQARARGIERRRAPRALAAGLGTGPRRRPRGYEGQPSPRVHGRSDAAHDKAGGPRADSRHPRRPRAPGGRDHSARRVLRLPRQVRERGDAIHARANAPEGRGGDHPARGRDVGEGRRRAPPLPCRLHPRSLRDRVAPGDQHDAGLHAPLAPADGRGSRGDVVRGSRGPSCGVGVARWWEGIAARGGGKTMTPTDTTPHQPPFSWGKFLGYLCSFCILALFVGLIAGGMLGLRPLEGRAARLVDSGRAEVHIQWPATADGQSTWLPRAEQEALLAIANAALEGEANAFAHAPLRRVADALGASGWFQGRPTAARGHGGAINVTGVWRIPAAVVRSGGKDYLISWDA